MQAGNTGHHHHAPVTTSRCREPSHKQRGRTILTAADAIPEDLSEALTKINNRIEHSIEPSRVSRAEHSRYDTADGWQIKAHTLV